MSMICPMKKCKAIEGPCFHDKMIVSLTTIAAILVIYWLYVG